MIGDFMPGSGNMANGIGQADSKNGCSLSWSRWLGCVRCIDPGAVPNNHEAGTNEEWKAWRKKIKDQRLWRSR